MIELLKSIPSGMHEIKEVTTKKFLWFSYKREKIIGYVKLDCDLKIHSLLSTSHKDHHAKTSEFPCINILFNDQEILSRAINYVGVWQQIQSRSNIEKFDSTVLRLIKALK